MVRLLSVLLFLCFLPNMCEAHGYLIVPPQRSSFWRERAGMPINYQDNQLNCGGYGAQWYLYGGRCGTCGDPFGGPWSNQPPDGKYATGTIARCYEIGTTYIDVKVVLTSNHMGTIQFRICVNNDVSFPVTQECLDNSVLQLETQNGLSLGNTYRTVQSERLIEMRVILPENIVCSQCVLQWTYVTGNNWGCNGSVCGLGYGNQEHFINCADIAIVDDCSIFETTTSTTAVPTTQNIEAPTLAPWPPESNVPKDWVNCFATNEWFGQWKVDKWCSINCPMGYCPRSHCYCPDI